MRTNAGEVMDRLLKVLNLESDAELSRLLNKPKTTVSSWRTRDSVPYDIFVQIADERGISLDWLLMGTGEMIQQPDNIKESANNYMVSVKAQKVAELFDGLNEAQQREILTVIEEKKQFNVMRAQLDRLLDDQEHQQMVG